MLRRLIVPAALVVLLALPAAAAARTVDVPGLFGDEVLRASIESDVPVRLPDTLAVPYGGRLFTSGTPLPGSWTLQIAAAKDCNGASVCFLASFAGSEKGRPKGPRAVALAGGRTGRFTPTRCGASCSPPRIQWKQAGDLYTIAAKVTGDERKVLRRAANQAIRGGERS